MEDDHSEGRRPVVVLPKFRRDAIRRATAEDAPALATCDVGEPGDWLLPPALAKHARNRQVRSAHWKRLLDGSAAGEYGAVWVADDEGEIVAYLHCEVEPTPYNIAQVVELYVGDGHGERGIQGLLLSKAVKLAQRHACRRLSVSTGSGHDWVEDDTRRVLRNKGFSAVSVGPGFCRGEFRKQQYTFVLDVMAAAFPKAA